MVTLKEVFTGNKQKYYDDLRKVCEDNIEFLLAAADSAFEPDYDPWENDPPSVEQIVKSGVEKEDRHGPYLEFDDVSVYLMTNEELRRNDVAHWDRTETHEIEQDKNLVIVFD
jgi:hypothetical protein